MVGYCCCRSILNKSYSLSTCLYQANWGKWRCASIRENHVHTYKLLRSSLKMLIKMNSLPISLYSCKINITYRCIFLSSLKTDFFFGSKFVYQNECFYNWIYSKEKLYIRGQTSYVVWVYMLSNIALKLICGCDTKFRTTSVINKQLLYVRLILYYFNWFWCLLREQFWN